MWGEKINLNTQPTHHQHVLGFQTFIHLRYKVLKQEQNIYNVLWWDLNTLY